MDYKILFIKNNVKKLNLAKDWKKYFFDWFKANTPLNITYDEISTTWKVTPSTTIYGNANYKGHIIGGDIYEKIRAIVPPNKYNVVCLISDDNMGVQRPYGISNLEWIYPGTDFIQIFKFNDGGKVANHENHHTFVLKVNRQGADIIDPMDTYTLDSDFNVDSVINTNRELALLRLKPHWDKVTQLKTMSRWKHFKLEEFTNSQHTHTVAELKPELVDILDKMREECGFAFNISSGFRTKAENDELIDAVGNSSHLTALASDVLYNNDNQKFKMVSSAIKNGITRIGIAKTFLHFDIDKTKPQNVIWDYN